MTRSSIAAILAVAQLGASAVVLAADPRFPDWPCNQIKVPELSVAAVWAGPPIDDAIANWESDPQVRDLVARLAARRTSLDEAQEIIERHVTGTAAEKQDKAKRLFAGLFDTLNRQRSEVMNGIERFARRQREAAEQIRSDANTLRALQDAAERDQRKLDELSNQITWETRIFEERHKTINYVCEVPVEIERRLFSLARTLQQTLE
jgi:exonuclease VII large subunit